MQTKKIVFLQMEKQNYDLHRALESKNNHAIQRIKRKTNKKVIIILKI